MLKFYLIVNGCGLTCRKQPQGLPSRKTILNCFPAAVCHADMLKFYSIVNGCGLTCRKQPQGSPSRKPILNCFPAAVCHADMLKFYSIINGVCRWATAPRIKRHRSHSRRKSSLSPSRVSTYVHFVNYASARFVPRRHAQILFNCQRLWSYVSEATSRVALSENNT